MKTIPYGRQNINDEDIRAVTEALKSDFITQGPVIQQFEEAICEKLNVSYAVAFNSGTAALHGACFALGLSRGSEFITSPLTFVATSNAGLYLGYKPVFCDVEEDTGNIDPKKIEQLITKDTRFITPVHYSGHPADLEEISRIAKKNNLKLIEDASHALGAKYKDTNIGDCSFSDMATFSFHPVKHIATGEGGAVVTNSKEYYERLQQFRNHGITKDHLIQQSPGNWYYEMQELGFNYRITDFQSALGISQLSRLENNIARRREIAATYYNTFKEYPFIETYPERDYAYSAWHLYPARLTDPEKRKGVFESLRKKGIMVQVHYIPVYQQPYYQNIGFKGFTCDNAEDFYSREISLPMFPGLSDADLDYTIETIKSIIDES